MQWHAENAKDNPKIIHATERCAAGIIQAIGHFHLGPSISPRDITDLLDNKLEIVNPGYEVVKFYLFNERWRRAEVDNSEAYITNLEADFVRANLPFIFGFHLNNTKHIVKIFHFVCVNFLLLYRHVLQNVLLHIFLVGS